MSLNRFGNGRRQLVLSAAAVSVLACSVHLFLRSSAPS